MQSFAIGFVTDFLRVFLHKKAPFVYCLQEVLELTQDLISQKLSAETEGIDLPLEADLEASHQRTPTSSRWKVGDEVVAPWSEDKQ